MTSKLYADIFEHFHNNGIYHNVYYAMTIRATQHMQTVCQGALTCPRAPASSLGLSDPHHQRAPLPTQAASS